MIADTSEWTGLIEVTTTGASAALAGPGEEDSRDCEGKAHREFHRHAPLELRL